MEPLSFILGQALPLEETRIVEFKEVKGNNAVSSIANAADEYAVAFLNSDGGKVFWGVRDSDSVVVGVHLPLHERDRLRREVNNKLHAIQPQIDPTRFRLDLHPVNGSVSTPDLFVVELEVPRVTAAEPFYAGGHEAFVRVDGVKKKLSGPQLTAWIKSRAGASEISAPVEDRQVASLVSRIRRILAAHGVEPGHLPRFLKICRAPFTAELSDFQNDGALLRWVNEEKVKWFAETFAIRREWIDGEDESIHEHQMFDKRLGSFFSTVSKHLEVGSGEMQGMPVAHFIRWGRGKQWKTKGDARIFVILGIPLAQLSSERTIYKYISDFTPYPWDYGRTNIQLRAWTRLLFLQKDFYCRGYEIEYKKGEELYSNSLFLNELVEDLHALFRIDWHPDDYALSARESVVAKDVETFPQVLEFLREHGLPCEEDPGWMSK